MQVNFNLIGRSEALYFYEVTSLKKSEEHKKSTQKGVQGNTQKGVQKNTQKGVQGNTQKGVQGNTQKGVQLQETPNPHKYLNTRFTESNESIHDDYNLRRNARDNVNVIMISDVGTVNIPVPNKNSTTKNRFLVDFNK